MIKGTRTAYKIQYRGLFSTGGMYPHWSKVGKTWHTRGALTRHLGLLGANRVRTTYPPEAMVVEYLVVETYIGSYPAWEHKAL